MSFGFMGGAYNHATGTLAAFTGLSAALEAEGFPGMVSKSGDREPEDQLALWYQRMTLDPGNRKVYGTTRWGGRIWYRIHPDKVGIPGTSNHERRRSNDLAYPYNDASTKAHKRAQALAPKFGITWEGKAFSEPWHWTFWGALGTITTPSTAGTVTPITPAQPEKDEDDMKNSGVYYEPSKGTVTYLLFNTGSGWYHEFSNGTGAGPMPSDYNNALAGTLGTGSWAKVTASHARVIKTSCDAVRRTTLAGSVSVDVNES